MALENAYATLPELKDSVSVGVTDTSLDRLFEMSLNAASRQIDEHCGRPHGFWQDATVVTRVYSPEDMWCCPIPDSISTTTGLVVKVDTGLNGGYATTLTINTDFRLTPPNALLDGRAFDDIRLLSTGSQSFQSAEIPYVQVTAKFGWASTPWQVRDACLHQARRLYKASPFGIVESPDFAIRLGASLHPDAKALLAGFVREYA